MMDIQKWLKEQLEKIQNSDPSELMKKLEQYGLVESD